MMSSLLSEELYTIVYYSSARGWSDDTLEQILEVSRKNNSRLGITGLILVVDGSILQWLEGPKNIVLERYEVIKEDPRHQQVSPVLNRNISERQFSSWSMGFIPTSEIKPELLDDFVNISSPYHREKFIESIPRLARVFAQSFLSLNR